MFIAFKNGIYNILTDKLEDFNPDYVITNKIDHNYNPDAYSEVADKTLSKMACQDDEIRSLLEEMIGSCFYRSNKLAGGKAFILTGNKSNGKSTFLDMIKNLMGRANCSALDLNELGERFNKSVPFGKLVNIGDDIGDKFIDDSSIFKKMVTGEDIAAERKGQDPFNYTSTCKLMFASNNLPKVRDKTGAIKRRLIIIPFNAEFKPTDADFDPMIGFRLMQEDVMEYLIRIGIEGLKRVIANNAYTVSKKTKIALDAYDKDNNPILYFFEDLDFDLDIDCQPTNEVYDRYREFCIENNLQQMSNIEFTKSINREFGTTVIRKRVDGKLRRIFTK
jgi:putative DNA primase/helicase